ncbi:HD-GYP domain-containing protein [Eubacterium xylanophilum]|uniref:HD-GYP domain-containing protein n=1 Tax=Eubacterium xylanophilum TaxID=39497 RepID=UPI00047CFEDE|nr:HD domain-containing phosphohydrolase [Eubacterium xylanophilum]
MEIIKMKEDKNNQFLTQMHTFVKVLITAIETRTPYNANHTKNMVQYASNYLDWLEKQGRLGEDHCLNRDPIIMSIWLHDIGKLVIPREIMDKSTRLGAGIDDIRHRIEVSKLVAKVDCLENRIDESELREYLMSLDAAFRFIDKIDKMEHLTDEMIEQVSKIAKIQCKKADGTVIKFLEENELSALSLKNGTLTKEEREVIKSHVSHTKDMLDAVSFTGQYKNVPEWASRHHEFLDGSGYPEGLKAEDLAWETRLLTILDIFDALTAEDRPYKTPHTPSTAFEIMRNMVSEGKIDGDILEDLYKSRAWELDD